MRREANVAPWNTARAMAYGAIIGAVAAAFKLLAPWSERHTLPVIVEELVGAALAFGLLCGLAAALRNFIARRLIWPKIQ
jgi:hypothetical protein